MEETDRNALLTYLQILRSEIEFSKRQQWSITNYTLLLYGAIFSIHKIVKVKIACFESSAIHMTSAIFVLSVFLLVKCQISIGRSINRSKNIHEKFPVLHELINMPAGKSSSSFWFLIPMICIVLIGAILAGVAIYNY